MTLDSLAERMNRYAERAMDAADRDDYTTDEFLRGMLAVCVDMADCCVWSRHTDFNDYEAEQEKLHNANERANTALSYLRSGAAEMQRALIAPAPDVLERIKKIYGKQHRQSSPYCTVRLYGDFKPLGVVEKLVIPSTTAGLKSTLFRCGQLSEVRAVLAGIGLTTTYHDYPAEPERNAPAERVVRINEIQGEEIVRMPGN